MLERPAVALLSRSGGAVAGNAGAVMFIGRSLSYCDTPASISALQSSIRNERTDWVRIIAFANRNGVTSALWLGLNRKGLADHLPDDVRNYLALVYDLNRQRNQQILSQASEAVAALNSYGVQPVFMKGCLTLLEGTLDIGSSMLTDIDIIVREDDISKAFSALRSIGYITLGVPAAHAHAWTFHRSMSLVTIDLHRDAGPQRGILPADTAVKGAVAIAKDAPAVRGLNVTHRVLLLIMSFGIFERHYYGGDVPLRNLHNLASLCHQHSGEIDWKMIADTVAAHKLGAEAASWGAMARCCLDAPVPTSLYQRGGAHAHLVRCLLQLSCPPLEVVARWYASVVWSLSRFRMDYRYDCGTGGFSLQAARFRHIAGILARRSSTQIQLRFVKPAKARPTGSPE